MGNVDTNQTRTGRTDATGSIQFRQLPVGTYGLTVTSSGFEDFRQTGLVVTIGQTIKVAVTLQPRGVVETVAVTPSAPSALDVRQTASTTTVDNERIEELPVQSRDYLHFVQLAPGLATSPPPRAASTTGALPDSGFSFAGLRPRSNMLTIDGLDNNDRYSGASRTELSLEIVREFQVITNGWSAENGGASGGAINVVTKSGTNIVHGDTFVFVESGRLNAPPPLEETGGIKPKLTRYRAGVAVGGPLVKDRTFFYTAAEREQSNGQAASDIDPSVAATINGALRSSLPARLTPSLTTGLFPTSLTETEWSGKLNHQFSARDNVMARVAGIARDENADAFNTGGLTDVSARGSNRVSDTGVTATWTRTIGSSMTNELRSQFATRNVDLHTGDAVGPGVIISGVAEFGRPYAGNGSHEQRYLELGDTVAWTRGSHLCKAGAGVTHVSISGTRTDGMGGFYLFPTLPAFVAGQPDSFRQVLGATTVDVASMHVGSFFQDHWTIASRVTLDAGVRFDGDTFPSDLNIRDRQWSPRGGAAWTPRPKWVVRGGAGVFADRLVLAAVEPALLVNGVQGHEQIAGSGAPSIYSVRPGSWHPSSRQASIGVERELSQNVTASVNALFVQGRQLPRTVNVNLLPPTVLTVANASSLGVDSPTPQQLGRPTFGPGRLDPAFDGILQLQSSARSTYHGVTTMLNRRLANEFEWSAAYTWSHATDTASDFDEQPQNPYDLNAELADSRFDQRHRFVASTLFDLPIGDEEDRPPGETPGLWTRVFSNIEMAPILTVGSGQPANAVTGADDMRTRSLPPAS
ncbi:MAG TPA: TonB-dependent receptor, partial [Vicinamibacterales bacterium]